MKKWYVPLLLAFLSFAAAANHEYELRLSNHTNSVEAVNWFSTFEDCRKARATLLHVIHKYPDIYYVTCTPSDDEHEAL